MNSRSTHRVAASLVSAIAIAGSLGPAASAYVPDVESDGPLSSARTIVVVPDAAERAAKRGPQKLRATDSGPDAFERAALRHRR